MRKKLTFNIAAILVVLLLGFTSLKKNTSFLKSNCGSPLYASNNASGTPKIYRVTYYVAAGLPNCSSKSKVVNLTSGNSAFIDSPVCDQNEIDVQTTGIFNFLSIVGNSEIARLYYNGGNHYFFSVNLSPCGAIYTINMY